MSKQHAENSNIEKIKYLQPTQHDYSWGVAITTVGCQYIPAKEKYPLSLHPQGYNFTKDGKRTLNEYQLVYITRGAGYFESSSCSKRRIEAGCVFILYPGEWHSYYPDPSTGWDEYWIGFNGNNIDNLIRNGNITFKQCVFNIGIDNHITDAYNEIYDTVCEAQKGYQQLASGILQNILGRVYYKAENHVHNDSYISRIINQAKTIIKEDLGGQKSLEDIARELNVSYSLFRREFRLQCGISPGQYCQELKVAKAKELLRSTNLSIAEIAKKLHFECLGQFSTFFRKRMGVPPLEYRKRISHETSAEYA